MLNILILIKQNMCCLRQQRVTLFFDYAQFVFLILFIFNPISVAVAEESFCARVSIEIKQELTFERQGFDAHMRINNGLEGFVIENVNINVKFSDENGNPVLATSDPNNTEAAFFIRIDSLSGIDDVSGTGTIPSASSADIHWLIIPAPGAAGNLSSGKMYFVGATLSYRLNGEDKVVEVSPDFIFVKPMPLLSLDYFLPKDVYADDAFTAQIEPPVPFTLGVRVNNNGQSVARNLKIDSSQPRIIDNELGLLINFRINSSYVDDQPVFPTLLLDFGDVAAQSARMGRWQMETTLSGQFVEFTANFSHADELGGELTSLLSEAVTHELIWDVLVDLPGRDGILDFLARDGDVLRVYESNGVDTPVIDQSDSSVLNGGNSVNGQTHYNLTMPATNGFLFSRINDPHFGSKIITQVIRSDGKVLVPTNYWLSKTRRPDNGWNYFINLFDQNSGGSYTLVMESAANEPAPPVLQFIPNRNVVEGQQVSFIVEASDPNGTLPTMTAAPLPTGATYTIDANGSSDLSTYIFDWTPATGQAGIYDIVFTASDGQFNTSQTARITVCDNSDTDCDGMADSWEIAHFGNLNRNGSNDLDGDGYSDLDEYLKGMDPKVVDAPSTPEIIQPDNGAHVQTFSPLLQVNNSVHSPGVETTYYFEVYDDESKTNLVTQAAVVEQTVQTGWTIDNELSENTWYYWRVRVCNPDLCSLWADSKFFVNLVNDLPGVFHLSSPTNQSDVSSGLPVLQISNSVDPDGDQVTYHFEVYADTQDGVLVASVDNVEAGIDGLTSWQVDFELEENRWYFWKAIASDLHGASRDSNEVWSFRVNSENSTPSVPTLVSPVIDKTVADYSLNLVVGNSTDPDNSVISYLFELDGIETFDSTLKRISGNIAQGEGDTTSWFVDGLVENTLYYWRAKADDGLAQSEWVNGQFFVNAVNEPPSKPVINNPGDSAWVETLRPALSVFEAIDPDGDLVNYQFELYGDPGLTNLINSATTPSTDWVVDTNLIDNTWYFWRVRAIDEHGMASGWSEVSAFFVNDSGYNDLPAIDLIQPSTDVSLTEGNVRIAWIDSDPDSNAKIDLYYEFGAKGSGGHLIASNIFEDPDTVQDDEYLWDISSLPSGDYFIYALIKDEDNEVISYAEGKVHIGIRRGSVSVYFEGNAETSESGISFIANVVLNSKPESDVIIPLQSSNIREGIVMPSSLVFTPDNWSEPQSIQIQGVNDCAPDGDINYNISLGPAQSEGLDYVDVDPDDISLINLDNDEPDPTNSTVHICNYTLIDVLTSGRKKYEHIFKAELTNSGDYATKIKAVIESKLKGAKVLDENVSYGPIGSGETMLSQDTFIIQTDSNKPFDPSVLNWKFIVK